jgi:hypothetical protein
MKIIYLTLILYGTVLVAAQASAQTNSSGVSSSPANAQQEISLLSPSTWPPQVLAAVITSGVTTLTTFISFLWGLSQKKKAKKAIETTSKVIDRLTERLGFKIGSIRIEAIIEDSQGLSKTDWEYNDVQIIRHGAQLPNIPGRMWFAPPNSEITKPPTLVKHTFSRPLNLTILERTKNSCDYQVEITGSLNHGDGLLSYKYTAEISNAFFMVKEDLDAAPQQFKREYWGFNIVIPVDKLEVSISFPPGYRVATYPGACLGDVLSEKLLHGDELQRIGANKWFEKGPDNDWARLRVEEPIVGFTYFIYWTPLPKKT